MPKNRKWVKCLSAISYKPSFLNFNNVPFLYWWMPSTFIVHSKKRKDVTANFTAYKIANMRSVFLWRKNLYVSSWYKCVDLLKSVTTLLDNWRKPRRSWKIEKWPGKGWPSDTEDFCLPTQPACSSPTKGKEEVNTSHPFALISNLCWGSPLTELNQKPRAQRLMDQALWAQGKGNGWKAHLEAQLGTV